MCTAHAWWHTVQELLWVRSANSNFLSLRYREHYGMARYLFEELVGMYLACGHANGNCRRVEYLYQEKFPHRRHPNHNISAPIDCLLRGTGNFYRLAVNRGRERSFRTCWRESNCYHEKNGDGVNCCTYHHLEYTKWAVAVRMPFTARPVSSLPTPQLERFCVSAMCWASLSFVTAPLGWGRFWYCWRDTFQNHHRWEENNPHGILQCK